MEGNEQAMFMEVFILVFLNLKFLKEVYSDCILPRATLATTSRLSMKDLPEVRFWVLQAGGLIPLLNLIISNDSNLQHNAAFALYGLADNPDNVAAFVREGAVQTLLSCQACSQVISLSTLE